MFFLELPLAYPYRGTITVNQSRILTIVELSPHTCAISMNIPDDTLTIELSRAAVTALLAQHGATIL